MSAVDASRAADMRVPASAGRTAALPERTVMPPRLRVLPEPTASVAGNGIFAIIVVGLLVGGMAVLLLLNTTLSQGAFTLAALQQQQSTLIATQQALAATVDNAESPMSLQQRADAAGMVPVTAPVFLRLSDHKVLGDPTPARAPVVQAPDSAVPVVTAPTTGSPATPLPGAKQTTTATAGAKSVPAAGDGAVADPAAPATTTKKPTTPTTTGRTR